MTNVLRYFVVLLIVISPIQAISQIELGVKILGLTYHFKKSPHPQLYKTSLDKSGRAVVIEGLMFSAEYYVSNSPFSIKMIQAFFADCAGKLAGFIHLGLRATIHSNRHSLSSGLGPTWIYRKNWADLNGYNDQGLFNNKGNWQTRFVWYGGEIEYNFTLNGPTALSATLVPGIPELAALAVGFRTLPPHIANFPTNK